MIYIFTKNYKKLKKGMYLEVPDKMFTGQYRILMFWKWVEELLKKKIISLESQKT